MGRQAIRDFEGKLPAYEVIDQGKYLMTTARRSALVLPQGATVYDTGEGALYIGDGATAGGSTGGGGGGYTGISNPESGVLVSSATLAAVQGGGDGALITNEVLEESFVLGFKYSRLGFGGSFPTYSGGNAYIPYTAFDEDGATLDAGHGVRGTVGSRITAVTAQFDLMAGDADIYYRINEDAAVLLGTVTSGVTYNTFADLSIPIPAGSQVRFLFNSASSGSFTEPTITAFIRQPLVP